MFFQSIAMKVKDEMWLHEVILNFIIKSRKEVCMHLQISDNTLSSSKTFNPFNFQ